MTGYTKLFDPDAGQQAAGAADRMGDRSGVPYIYNDHIILAVNLALATRRPLLVRGSSGVGKSALARDVARQKQWYFSEIQMTSRTEAQDLLWRFDALRRLQDAQLQRLRPDAAYVAPGPLWHAFDRQSALAQSELAHGAETAAVVTAGDAPSVLLVDEIDKADPDVPNNLLTVLGNLAFEVEPLGRMITARAAPLIIITTNDERDLSPAFVRRCIELNVESPDAAMLQVIGAAHFPDAPGPLLEQVADRAVGAARATGNRVSTAEFLDLLQACETLGISVDDAEWTSVMAATFAKPKGRGEGL